MKLRELKEKDCQPNVKLLLAVGSGRGYKLVELIAFKKQWEKVSLPPVKLLLVVSSGGG